MAKAGRPTIGVISNSYQMNDRYDIFASGHINVTAVSGVAGCVPIIIPSDPNLASIDELLALCDGFLLTGGQPNVHPSEYGGDAAADPALR
jgi:putative glutamine amidotransferase